VECRFVPNQPGLFEAFGVRKSRHRTGSTTEDATQSRARLLRVERVTSRAHLVEEFFTSLAAPCAQKGETGGEPQSCRRNQCRSLNHCTPRLAVSGASTSARRSRLRTKFSLQTPRTERSLSAGTIMGPGEGALPGAGCGKAVDMAVWNATLPST